MDPSAERRSSHTRWLMPIAVLLMAAWGQGAARADIYVHVKNCADNSVGVTAFDAKDAVEQFPASKATVEPGDSQQLHCAGEGEGYCQMGINPVGDVCADLDVSIGFHLDSGKWAVVTGFEATNGKCTPKVESNLDAAPSCD